MSTLTTTVKRTALLSVALLTGLPGVRADGTTDDIQALRAQIEQLDQKLKVLERKQEIKDDDAAAAAKTAPKVNITDKGLSIASGDGANTIHLGGLVQFDSRLFFNDGGGVLNNSFVLRRARLIADGTFGKIYSFQIVPEFGGGSAGTASAVAIYDANLTVAPTQAVQFKFGKFKAPIGYEVLQSDPATFFVERSLVSNLAPSRDLGAQVGGNLFNGTVAYSIGAFNGIADATSTSGNSDFDNDKDVIARTFVQPLKNDKDSVLQGLAFGISGSDGREKGTLAPTAGYKTDGQQTFFKYKGIVGDGRVWRVSPQADFRYGPFGVIGEYLVSAITVRNQAALANPPTSPQLTIKNKAWQVAAGYVLTGENSSYTGVVPTQPFSWENGTWGAWEVVARYEDLKLDNAIFTNGLADTTALSTTAPATAKEASAFGVGVNWYLSKTVRASVDYFDTKFTDSAAPAATAQILRQDEKALTTRLQFAF